MPKDNLLLADADICVKCGLCLPHCPTYLQTQDENESPRGRIALIQAWANDQLDGSATLDEHIDNCLLCRSCERICPAVMPYGRLIDNFRRRRYLQNNASLALSIMKKVSHNKTVNRLAKKGLKLYQTSRLQKTARLLKLPSLFRLDTIDRLLPDYREQPESEQGYYPAKSAIKGDVGLFVGCMGALLDQETVNAAIQLLTAVGFNVHIPESQVCCGALAQHSGDQKTTERLAASNGQAFADQALTAIITIASGCGSQLQEYQDPLFAGKIIDISQFLLQFSDELSEHLQPLSATVCLHTPCSLKNVMRAEKGALKLLQSIPDLTIIPLPETIPCCGSAGSYMLDHSKMAQALLGELLTAALKKQPDYLVSSNIGCALHIAAGLRDKGLTLEVVHPVVLIARQM